MDPIAIQRTSAYYQQGGAGLRVLRGALGTLQRLQPALAARAAARIFTTPLPPRWTQPRSTWSAAWRITQRPFEGAGLTVYTHVASARAPTVLLVHGWGGQAGQMQPLAEAIAQAGLHPLVLELPAHGRSRGSASSLPQFARAVETLLAGLRESSTPVHAVIGHSLGASACARALAVRPGAQRLVLIAPPASPRAYTRHFAHLFGLAEATRARMQALIEVREGIAMAQFEPAAVAPGLSVPALVVHDREDRVNRHADGAAFAQAILGARLLSTEGLGHRKLLRDPGVIREVLAFLH